jgi:putative aldouronate transport system permease protein
MVTKKYKYNASDKIFYFIVYFIALLALLVTLYPFLYIISLSMSSESAIANGKVFLWPVDINFASYKLALNASYLWKAYGNSIYYTVVGTAFNILFTVMAAYPLSQRRFFVRRFFNVMFTFTMYFTGGLIPLYVLVTTIGIYNTRWAMILPTLVSVFNVMICRTSFEGIPKEIIESATIDGANDIRILFKLAVPLIKGTIAVLVLYYAVGHWNEFFHALLFLADQDLHPIQIILQRVVISASPEISQKLGSQGAAVDAATVSAQIRYTVIVLAITPILFVYPFIQKYLIKGVMIGGVKG